MAKEKREQVFSEAQQIEINEMIDRKLAEAEKRWIKELKP